MPQRLTPLHLIARAHALVPQECTVKLHSAEAGLADPSATVGLLWVRRGFEYWLSLFRPICKWGDDEVAPSWAELRSVGNGRSSVGSCSSPGAAAAGDGVARARPAWCPTAQTGSVVGSAGGVGTANGYAESMRAYDETISKWHGWVVRKMFTVAARATPEVPRPRTTTLPLTANTTLSAHQPLSLS